MVRREGCTEVEGMRIRMTAPKITGAMFVMAALLVAGGGALAPSSVASATAHRPAPPTCTTGTTYTHIRMNPAPIAQFGSLLAGQGASFFVQPLNGTQCVAGAVVYVSNTEHVVGDAITVQIPSECGGATRVTATPVACTTDSTGKLNFTYTSPSTIPDHGTAEVTASNHSSGGGFSSHDWYLYEMLYRFSSSPIAPAGTLAAGQTVTDTLSVTGVGGTAQPSEKVFLSLTSTASSSGTAMVGATALTGSPAAFTADSSGTIQISYTAPATLPTTGVDTISADSTASGTNLFNSAAYAFAASEPTVSAGDITQVEGDGHGSTEKGTFAEFDVTLSAPQATAVTVKYETVCGIGDKGCKEDYLQTQAPTFHTVTFAAGQVSQLIKVVYYSYSAPEAYSETMFVQLFGASGAILGRSIGNGTIIQDDETTSAEILYAGDAGVVRGDSGTQFVEFTVTLALPSTSAVTFHYATADGTAASGTDYIGVSGTGTIPAGLTSAHISVAILPDLSPGTTLTFTFTISGSSGPTIERATGTGSIINWN
jgi:hypothetical protein